MKIVFSDKNYTIFQVKSLEAIDANCLSTESDFFTVLKTSSQITVISESASLKDFQKAESGWKMIYIDEVIAFDKYGVLNALLTRLASAGVSVLVSSSYETDYIFYKEQDQLRVIESLEGYNLEFHSYLAP